MVNNYILNQEVFNKAVEEYKKELPNTRPNELFKWQAVQWFQDHWNIDAENFQQMLLTAFGKSASLLAARHFFALEMISSFAEKEPELVRNMFKELFDESLPLLDRAINFELNAKEILKNHFADLKNDYQNFNAISTYLWFKYPDKYYIYKSGDYREIAFQFFNLGKDDLPSGTKKRYEELTQCIELYDVLNEALKKDTELIQVSDAYLVDGCYLDELHHILAVDFVFFYTQNKEKLGNIVMNSKLSLNNNSQGSLLSHQLNQILYGPPGTGKTYKTVEEAVAICDPDFKYDSREQLKKRYDDLIENKQISFVTFHQSFSYEDFVEGIRAKTENGQIEYEIEDGIFKEICQLASVKENKNLTEGIQDLKDREVWKMSLGDTLNDSESSIYDECLENNYVLLGYGYALDYSDCNNMKAVEQKVLDEIPNSTKNDFVITAVNRLKNSMDIGDLIVVTDGNRKFRAIAEITGDYFLLPNEERNSYRQARPVKWLRVFESSIPVSAISTVNFSQMSIYQFYTHKLKIDQLLEYIQPAIQDNDKSKNYVLIIDEINRGNIANIFGELITLLEPSKRAGNDDACSVTLPYSKESFSVPNNLYVIGTMNTSDHSLTKLDLALRRRFEFVELLPDYGLLNDIEVHDVNIGEMLKIMNERIEILLGRDHLIGHSYFLPLENAENREDMLSDIFKNKIIPLLQEYFFEDWERIQWVLNDQNKKDKRFQFVNLMKNNGDKDYLTKLFGNLSEFNHIPDRRYQINNGEDGKPNAFNQAEAYQQIIKIKESE